MNLQPKILSNAFLINGYTPAVDMILVMYITFTASPGDIYPPQQTFSAFSHLHRAFADCSLQQFLLLLYCTVFRQ